MPESSLTSQVLFCRLHGDMTEQKLNLLEFASRIITEASAGPPEIVRRKFRDSQPLGIFLHDVPDYLLRNFCSLKSPIWSSPAVHPQCIDWIR